LFAECFVLVGAGCRCGGHGSFLPFFNWMTSPFTSIASNLAAVEIQ
jgi:hypothetical protein